MLKTVLVTGAGGFIGSHLVEHLVREGRDVHAMVNYNSRSDWGWLDALPAEITSQIQVFANDVRDFNAVRSAMKGCEGVLNLAALIAIPYSYRAPQSYVETNIMGTLNVAQAACDLSVRRMVQISTSEVYGTPRRVPISEEDQLQGQSPYAASKIGADQLALSFHRSFDLPLTVIRPFNTYGPRQSARAIIPTIISQVAAGSEVIRLGNLAPTRDLSFVTDTVAGMAAALDCDGIEGEVINLGSAFEISMGELAECIVSSMGGDARIEQETARMRPEKSEVERLWADTSKAARLLGWNPSFAGRDGLQRGLSLTAEWFLKTENLARYKSAIYNL
jgi:NAD dependent epimerase/dehydratase